MKKVKSIKKLISMVLVFAMVLTSSVVSGVPQQVQAEETTTAPAITPVTGGAITYYVATDGNDAADGSTTTPFLTVAKGVSQLKPGDTLIIKEGEYNDNLNLIGLKGTADAPITVKGEGAVKLSKAMQNSYTGKYCVGNIQSCDYVNVSNINFNFYNDKADEAQTLLVVNDTNVKVSNCLFTDDPSNAYSPYAQIRVGGCENVTFDSNTITGGGSCAFYLWGNISKVTFTNNVITTYYGLAFQGVDNCKIINNVFKTIDGAAFYGGSYTNNIIANNIFVGSVGGTLDSTNICEYNAYTNSASVIPGSNTNVVATSSEIFAASGDYHLADNSPCIAAGSSASYVPSNDINGSPRRIPSDIGAYNYGNIYYVSTSGSNENNGLSIDQPLATFATAVAALKADPGSSLMVEGGIYAEQLNLEGIGSVDSIPCNIKSYNGTATLTGYAALTIKNSYNLNVSGFTIDGSGLEPAALLEGAINCKLHDSVITNGTVGLKIAGGTKNCDIYNNDFANGGGYDIYLKDSSYNNLYNNIFTGYYGILNDTAFANTVITNNVFKNDPSGFAISGLNADSTGNTIQNNIFAAPMSYTASNTYNYNLYDSSIFTSVPAGEGDKSIVGDPAFTDSSYRIGIGSKCRDAGIDNTAAKLDRDGKARDGVTDIGAYEYITKGDTFVISAKTPSGTGASVSKDTTKIQITFSETLKSELNLVDFVSVTKTEDGSAIAGTLSRVDLTTGGTEVTFTADSNFAYSTSYTVTVKQGITNTNDKTLNSVGDVSWNFTTEVYVLDTYYIAMDGNDSNTGTIDSPKKTLNSFKNVLKPGDTVIWRAGTYDEYVVLSKEMPAGADTITFKAYDGEKVILTASTGSTVYATFYALGKNQNVRFEGLTFEPTGDQDYKGNALRFYNYGGSKVYVNNCTFYRCSPSISLIDELDQKFEAVEISNNKIIADGAGTGLYFREVRMKDGSYGKIYNNVIYHAKWSLNLWGRSTNLLFYNNTFADTYDTANGTGWFDIYPVQGTYNSTTSPINISEKLVFKNNIFTKPIRTQLEGGKSILDDTQNCVFDNNVYASNSLANYVTYNYGGEGPKLTFAEMQDYQTRGLELNGKYGKVSFVKTGSDARIIEADNAAIGAAASEIIPGVSAPTTDINGNPRTKEAGAFAYDGSLAFVGEYTGNDANGSLSKPYASIQAAIAAGAKQIQVKEGTYSNDQTISKEVSITPYEGAVNFTGAVTVTGSDSYNVAMSGVQFGGTVTVTGSNVEISNSTFTGNLVLDNANGAVITNNKFAAADSDAVTLNSSSNCSITNNVITERAAAVKFTTASSSNAIYNNTLYGNTDDINLSDDSINNTFKNNIISTMISNRSNNTFDYNLYNADKISQSDLNSFTEEHAVKAPAGFINALAKDYRIYKLSACVGAGIMDVNTPAKDINGITRKNPPDIGAYTLTAIKMEYYVDAVSGNDANAGTSNAPFKTINAALKVLRDGETVNVLPGSYKEDIYLTNKSAQEADSYIIKSNGTATLNGVISLDNTTGVTIDGFSVVVPESSSNTAITVNNSSKTKLVNVTIKNAKTGINAIQSKELVVSNSVIENVENGVVMDGVSTTTPATITQTKVNNASTVAIEAKNAVSLTLTSSVITNSAKGVVSTGESGVLVVNNTFYNNSGYSLDITQTIKETPLNIYNNIFSRSTRGQGAFSCINKTTGFMSEYNLYDAAAGDVITHFYGVDQTMDETVNNWDETCGLIGDPKFKDAAAGDFTVAKGSDASRNGSKEITDTISAPDVDYAGTAYSTKGQDIGAYYSPYSCITYHIAGDNAGWSDGTGDVDSPFRTLAQAVNVIDSGDTVIVHKGIYSGRYDMYDKHGVADAPITFVACDDPDCEICKANASLPGPVFTGKSDYTDVDEEASAECMTQINSCSYITIEGLNITGFRGAGIWAMDCDNIVLKDLNIWDIDTPQEITSGVQGILVNGTTNSLFKNLNIWDIGQTRKSQADHGAYIGGCSNCTFDGLKVQKSPGGGIQFYAGDNYNVHSTDCVVKNCVFSESNYGLILVGIEGFTITNNTFYNSWGDDLYLDWTVNNNLFQNNIFYNDRTEPVSYSWTTETLKPVIVGYQYNCIRKNDDGSTTSTITNNIFRNNLYEYVNFPAVCNNLSLSDSSAFKGVPIADFMASENNAETNNKYIDMYSGNVNFMGTFENSDTEYQKAQKIMNNILDLKEGSDCINKGIAEYAPSVDILGRTRKDAPDLGAYECNNVAAGTITLSKETATMEFGDSLSLIATVNPISSNDAVKFSSSDSTVASVDQWGTVTALKAGTAVITASAGSAMTHCVITVTVDTSKKSIKVLKTKFIPGETIDVYYAGTTTKDWIGSYYPGEIPTGDGPWSICYKYVDANSYGIQSIGTASGSEVASLGDYDIILLENDGYTELDRVSIHVVEPVSISGVTISESALSLQTGDTSVLSASVNADTTYDNHIVWSSSDTSVVAVDQNGRLLAAGKGTAVITATSYADGSKKDSCTVTVSDVAMPTVTPTPTEAPATATPTPTEAPATATPTPTEAPATATPTPTETPATATPTPTVAPATATPTPTEAPATATPTPTVAPATATPTPTVAPTSTPNPTPVVTQTTNTEKDKDGSVTNATKAVLEYADGTKVTIKTEVVNDADGKQTSAKTTIDATPVIKTEDKAVTFALNMPTDILLQQAEGLKDGTTLDVTYKLPQASLVSEIKKSNESYNVVVSQPSVISENEDIDVNISLPKAVLNTLKAQGSELTVTVQDEDQKTTASWTFDGDALKDSKAKISDINLAVGVNAAKDDTTAREILKKDTKNSEGIIVSLSETKTLPAQSSVKLFVGDQLTSDDVDSLYVYGIDADSKQLLALPNNKYKVDSEGYITLNIIEGQDYVLLPKKASSSVIAPLLDQVEVASKTTISKGKKLDLSVDLPSTLEQVSSLEGVTEADHSAVRAAKVTYKVSDTSIATIDSNGTITAKKAGLVKVTTTVTLSTGKKKTYTTTVTVK